MTQFDNPLDNEDASLDALLRQRAMEPPSANLAWRIYVRAMNTPQRVNKSLWQIVQRMFAEFHLPRPALALGLVLLLGFVVGLATTTETNSNAIEVVTVDNIYHAEKIIL